MTEPRGAVHFVLQPDANSSGTKQPYCGADDATEESLPEPTDAELRVIELEAENKRLKDDLNHLKAALASAAGLLLPYARRLNGQ